MPVYCRRTCRQAAYESRQRAGELGVGEHELVVARRDLDELKDQLWILQCALQDADADLAGSPTLRDYRNAFAAIKEAAAPLFPS
jgi:hypothetical protein